MFSIKTLNIHSTPRHATSICLALEGTFPHTSVTSGQLPTCLLPLPTFPHPSVTCPHFPTSVHHSCPLSHILLSLAPTFPYPSVTRGAAFLGFVPHTRSQQNGSLCSAYHLKPFVSSLIPFSPFPNTSTHFFHTVTALYTHPTLSLASRPHLIHFSFSPIP